MEDIKLNYEVLDANSTTVVISITSNEAENGLGDGDTAPDWAIVDEHNIQLRAERSGTGAGRTYTITIEATDIVGNTSSQVLTVTVPPNQKGQNNKALIAANVETIAQKGLNVSAYPNPSAQYFNLNIQSSSNTPVTVIITDVTGRVMETKSGVASNSNLTFGHSYQPGVYLVQVVQGTEKLVIKLVKKAD
ncbi:T9SS type A sorting domain-containing protein [Chitinophagaceae bacterium LB-8]|uniref:T9SS type A sorting domain-containing protein n=2 Tax=Paraflavisolibacter caeni TaxID=2982496 RepID=A0A9X2XYT1_9BACT|nr:T9SS type A sorting domain-containing protein [Paraflavisolibacter caeni]